MKKITLILLVLILAVSAAFTGCAKKTETNQDRGEKPYIAVVSKGEQHDFWQQVKRGAVAAATDYAVDVTFEGPTSESEVKMQVEMLNKAMAKAPVAIALAALDTTSVMDQLQELKSNGIPVVGFDSGVPNAPEGSIVANASTNNAAAAALAAEKMFAILKNDIEAATAAKPVTIVVMNQDASGESLLSRGKGFRDGMIEQIVKNSTLSKADIAVIGNPAYIASDSPTKGRKVFIEMVVPVSPNTADASAATTIVLAKYRTSNIRGLFCTNEGTVKGVLAATSNGAALASKYDIVVMGFDAGVAQKNAVRNGLLAGSITQDPYAIGYKAVELAYKASKGEPVSDVDTGAKYYTSENMDQEDIAPLLYD